MKILRYVIAIILLLLSLIGGGIAYIMVFRLEKAYVFKIAEASINIGYVVAGVSVFILLFALIVLPLGGKKKGAKGKQKTLSASEAKKQLRQQMDMQRITEPSEPKFEMPDDAGINPDENVETYSRLEDPRAMARLIAIEQGEMSYQVVSELLTEYYPKLTVLVDRVAKDDKSTLDTIGKHVISIARNRLKLTDKELSDNQFSIFQENVFNEEKNTFIQIYKPADMANLSQEQTEFVGKVVDKRAWESAQRRIRGERTDWHELSLDNAAELLGI